MEQQRWREQVDMLSNRLKKNQRKLRSWIKKEKITCYRLYDRDIPELPFAIDWYDGCLLIFLYAQPKKDNAADLEPWVDFIAKGLASALDVQMTDLYVKRRERLKGGTQYGRLSNKGDRIQVKESGLKFLVNLSDRIDTGLFLDHRPTRQMVRNEAKGKRFLNLFAYTGAFSVYAAAGGALETTSIDMSNTYLDWANENMAINNFKGDTHRFVRKDILGAFDEQTEGLLKKRYDLIVLDPPTISKSKKMERALDIQRDHPFLLEQIHHISAPGAVVYFSTNFRKFKLKADGLPYSRIEEITHKTIPPDFQNKRIHRCWRLHVV